MIRVIGLGSPFGDDRAGWELVASLRGRVPAAVDLVALDRPGAALVNWIEGVDWLVLVDAYLARNELGHYRRLDPAAVPPRELAWNSHALDLHVALALGRQLGLAPARLDVYAIAIDDPGVASRSAEVASAVRQLAGRLAAELGQPCRNAPDAVASEKPEQPGTTVEPGKNSLH
jgi:hydrogenase maturation protease